MTTSKKIFFCFILACIFLFHSLTCCKKTYTPKPAGYPRIDLPEKKYQLFDSTCPFVFEYPAYCRIVPDTSRISEPCWINIEFPGLNGKIHISYKIVRNNIFGYIEDSRTMAYKHTIKADAIRETSFSDNEKKVYGLLYEIKGDAASNAQFYLTDSNIHFVRGALYFNIEPNADSLAPIIDFCVEDIRHLMETFKWKYE